MAGDEPQHAEERGADPRGGRDRELRLLGVGRELNARDDHAGRFCLVVVGRGGFRRLVERVGLLELGNAAGGQGCRIERTLGVHGDVVDAPHVDRQTDGAAQRERHEYEHHGHVAAPVAPETLGKGRTRSHRRLCLGENRGEERKHTWLP